MGVNRVVRQAGNELVCCIEVRLGGMPSSFVSIALPSIIAKLSHGSKHPRTTHVGGQFQQRETELSSKLLPDAERAVRVCGRSLCTDWPKLANTVSRSAQNGPKDSSLIALQHCTGMRCRRASGGAAGGDEGDTAA